MAVVLFVLISGKGNLSNLAMYKQWNNLTRISGWKADGGVICGGGRECSHNPQHCSNVPYSHCPDLTTLRMIEMKPCLALSLHIYVYVYTAEGGKDEKREGVRVRVSAIV